MEDGSSDATDAEVAAMVQELRPDWTLEAVDRFDEGTDFAARLTVGTPDGVGEVVLKATTADLVAPAVARAEPRLLEKIRKETPIPVPDVIATCEEHPTLPAPFTLLEYVDAENLRPHGGDLENAARERLLESAGRHLAALHELGPLSAAGTIGVVDDGLAVLEDPDHDRYDDPRRHVLAFARETLDALAAGGYFPDLADQPDRFADLVPALRELLEATLPALPAPPAPTLLHTDYRYGNLLGDPATGTVAAVIDWANCSGGDPAYNLAWAEWHLLDGRSDHGRATLRDAYNGVREDWSFDADVVERMDTYWLVCRITAMACLPLWHRTAGPDRRDAVATAHREAVRRRIGSNR